MASLIDNKKVTLDPVFILNKELSEAHKDTKSSSTFPTTATRTFSISLQFDAPSGTSKLLNGLQVQATTTSQQSSATTTSLLAPTNSNRGIPCRFKSVIELGPVEQLASAPVETWRNRQTKHTWTAEEDLAIVKAPSALVAWESYRAARSAFPGSLEEADFAFSKPTETEEDRELFVTRWHALNEPENYERKRLLVSLQQARAFADDTQIKNDDDLLDRIREDPALTSDEKQRACALHKAVTRKIKRIRAIVNNRADGEPFDTTGLHSHAPPNTTLIGAMTPDLVIFSKSAPHNSRDEAEAETAKVKCSSSSVLSTSNLMKQIVNIHVAQQKSQEAAFRATRQREREEKEAVAQLEAAKSGKSLAEVMAAAAAVEEEDKMERKRVKKEQRLLERQQNGEDITSIDQIDDKEIVLDDDDDEENGEQEKFPPITLSEYDDQFGLSPGKDTFGVFSKNNLERFFNFCEDMNAVDLCAEAEAEYTSVRDAVERYSIRSSEAKLLNERRQALKSLSYSRFAAEKELRQSFQKTFDDVVASLANVFESHLATALQALRDKVDDEKERVESVFDMEEQAVMLARYKLGRAGFCPDSVANRKSFHSLEGRRGLILGDYEKWGISSQQQQQQQQQDAEAEDPQEIITKMLLLTEALQCPQLSQTLIQEIANTSNRFCDFYNRREFHEFPLLSRETMKALLSAAPLSQLIQAKQIENDARQEELDKRDAEADADYKMRLDAAQKARSTIPVERHPPPPPPPQSVLSQVADEELHNRRRVRREQLEQMSTAELADLLKRCKVTVSRLRRKFREQIRKQKLQMVQMKQKQQQQQQQQKRGGGGGAGGGSSSSSPQQNNNNNNNNQNRFGYRAAQQTAASSGARSSVASELSANQRNSLLPAVMSIKRKDIIAQLLEEDDDVEYDDEVLESVELARDVNAAQIVKLGEELTTDSGEEDEEKAIDVLVARLLTSSGATSIREQHDNSKMRVAITQSVNKFRMRRKKHVEDATHYIELIDEVLQKRLFSTQNASLVTGEEGKIAHQSSDPSKHHQQQQQDGIKVALKSSSLLLLTSSFKRGNRWRIHNKVTAHETAIAVSENGFYTTLAALKPLKTYTFFAMFPNEATLRRRCGTSSGKVFFQVRVLSGPGSGGNQSRLIGVGFDTSPHSRKVPMLNHDPLDPPNTRNNNSNTNRKNKLANSSSKRIQYDSTGKRILDPTIGGFKNRWNLSSTNEDMCMSILNKIVSKSSSNNMNKSKELEYLYDDENTNQDLDELFNSNDQQDDNNSENWVFYTSTNANTTNKMISSSSSPKTTTISSDDQTFIPGLTPAPHPIETALGADIRRSALSRSVKNSSGLDDEYYYYSSARGSDKKERIASSPFDTYQDDSRVAPDRANHGFLWLSNGTILLHGSTYALSRDGAFIAGDTLHVALDEAEGTVYLFRNGRQVASPMFIPCPPVDLITASLLKSHMSAAKATTANSVAGSVLSGGGGASSNLAKSNVANLFVPQLPQKHEAKPVLERAFWGIGPLIPCVTLVDSAPDHTTEGRAGNIGYLSHDLFSLQHKTFRKAMTASIDNHFVGKSTEGTSSTTTTTTSATSSGDAPAPPAPQQLLSAAATAAILGGSSVSDLDVNRFSLPSVEVNVEGPFLMPKAKGSSSSSTTKNNNTNNHGDVKLIGNDNEDEDEEEEDEDEEKTGTIDEYFPEFLIKEQYVPFLKAQREL